MGAIIGATIGALFLVLYTKRSIQKRKSVDSVDQIWGAGEGKHFERGRNNLSISERALSMILLKDQESLHDFTTPPQKKKTLGFGMLKNMGEILEEFVSCSDL